MLTTSQVNEITKNRLGAAKGKKRTKGTSSPRVRRASDLRHAKKLRQVNLEKIRQLAEQQQKITASGQRMCLWRECTTIISIYNEEECCSRHQRDWNARKRVISKE